MKKTIYDGRYFIDEVEIDELDLENYDLAEFVADQVIIETRHLYDILTQNNSLDNNDEIQNDILETQLKHENELKINEQIALEILDGNVDNNLSICGKQFYRYLWKENPNSLEENDLLLADHLIISRETRAFSDVKRAYTSFYGPQDFLDWLKNVPIVDRLFHEHVQPMKRQKMRFDIDVDQENFDKYIKEGGLSSLYSNIEQFSQGIIEEIIYSTCDLFENAIGPKNFLIYDSSRPGKKSYHMLIDGYYLPNNKHAKNLYDLIVKNILEEWMFLKKDELGHFIDGQIYGNCQSLRIIGCHKMDTNNVKRHVHLEIGNEFTSLRNEDIKSFISYIDENDEQIEFNSVENKIQTRIESCSAQEVKEILDMISNNGIGKPWADFQRIFMAVSGVLAKSEEGFDLLKDWMCKSTKYNDELHIAKLKTLWDGFNAKEFGCTMGTLKYYAKLDNPEAYSAWWKSKNTINVAEFVADLKVVEKFELEAQKKKESEPLFDRNDDFCWLDFDRKHRGHYYASYNEMIKNVLPDLSKVFAKIEVGAGQFIKKDDCDKQLFTLIKASTKFDLFFGYTTEDDDGNKVKHKVLFKNILTEKANEIPRFRTVYCHPTKKEHDSFNLWRGYKAQIVDDTPENIVKKLEPWLTFIKEVWCDNKDNIFEYFMLWLYYLIAKPEEKTRVAIFAYSEEQQVGKNTLTDFLSKHVLGNQLSCDVNGLATLVQKHNRCLESNKLMVINEASATRDEFMTSFNRMKHLISDNYIQIEPKGIDSYRIENLSNFFIFSNHKTSLLLEPNTPRYLCLEINPKYLNKPEFWNHFYENYYTDEFGNYFYTYFKNVYVKPENVFVRSPPSTDLKEEIIAISLPNSIRFLKDLKEQFDNEELGEQTEISGADLYSKYRAWCDKNGEKAIADKKFKSIIVRKREKGGIAAGEKKNGTDEFGEKYRGRIMYKLASIQF